MQRELELPDVGEGIAEGEIVRWLVEPGDDVTEDQPIAEVETDKAVVEVPSPIDGTVVSLHVDEGEIVAVGSVLVTFEVDGDTDVEASTGIDDALTTDADSTDSDATANQTSRDDDETDMAEMSETDAVTDAATLDEGVPASQVIAPPRVKRLARELDVAIGSLHGAADGKPITEADVRAATGQETATAGDGTPTAEAADCEKTLAAPTTRQLARELGVDIDAVPASTERNGQPFVTQDDVQAFNNGEATVQPAASAVGTADATGQREECVPYRGIRRTIGKRMAESKYTAPHVAHHDSVNISDLASIRRELNEELADDVSLTYLPFVMKAVMSALKAHPSMNAMLDEENEEIVQKRYYNIGVATATDAGLMVPVVRNVDQKGVAQLAREIDDTVDRARSREISPEEMRGGTFTITNFGAIGGDHATPIINYPEAAILGLGTIEKRPVVVEDEVVPRKTLPLSLSVDHRLIDGAIAASFTNDVKRSLHNPARMLL